MKDFDHNEAYKNEIDAKVQELKSLCYKNGIPMFFAAATLNKAGKTEYQQELVNPAIAGIPLYDNKIPDLVKIFNGFIVVPVSRDYERIELRSEPLGRAVGEAPAEE